MTPLILDGSNLCHEGQKKTGKFNTLGALIPCLLALLENRIEAWVIFDASFRHRLDKNSKASVDFETFLKEDERFRMAPAGTPADVFILEFAALRDFGVLSNDTFREYVKRKTKGKGPHFNGKPVSLHSFQMLMGAFVVPSLKIRYLIDEDALDVADIIAARTVIAPVKAVVDVRVKAAPTSSSDSARDAPAPLDFLIELSPLFLRAGDVFEVYRRVVGKAWKAGNSKKTAEDFALECFSQPVVYCEPPGRKKNDGYFFDARYDESMHRAVRSCLLDAGSKNPPLISARMLPLVATTRTRVLAFLELIHKDELASGFSFTQLCDEAELLGLPYYERYLRALLWALIAADGVCGADENERDIATILRGEMRVNPDENRTDMLNFLQRGILYLLADSDNVLPEVVISNLGWMFQLPEHESTRRAIIRGHLEWLKLEDL